MEYYKPLKNHFKEHLLAWEKLMLKFKRQKDYHAIEDRGL